MDIGDCALRVQIAWFQRLAASGFPCLRLPGGLAVASGLESNAENGAVLDPRSPAADELVAWLAERQVPAAVLLTGSALTRARIDAARRDGAREALVSSSPDGFQHRTLGFATAPTPSGRWFYLR